MTTEDTENTERENDLQCELAAWELLREAEEKYSALAAEHMLVVNKLAEERDQAREDLEFRRGLYKVQEQCLETARRERDEAQNELSSIHRWIERNHADGFIDSLTYFQNLERVTENWYDRLDRLEVDAGRFEKERDEARGLLASEKITRDHIIKRGIEMQKERDEARADAARIADILSGLELRTTGELARLEQERNEALAQIKELIYIAERAIALAEIDFENDKFGVVSELRDDLAKIKKSK
jgi:hypothetical protein